MKKKIFSVFFTVIITLTFSITAFAAENDDPNDYSWETEQIEGSPSTERWSYISSTSQGMHVSNDTATMTATLIGYKGTTNKVIIYMYLQQYYDGYWHNIHWEKDEFNYYRGSTEHYKSGCASGKYRLRVSYYAYGPDDKYENHIAYSAIYNY